MRCIGEGTGKLIYQYLVKTLYSTTKKAAKKWQLFSYIISFDAISLRRDP